MARRRESVNLRVRRTLNWVTVQVGEVIVMMLLRKHDFWDFCVSSMVGRNKSPRRFGIDVSSTYWLARSSLPVSCVQS